MVVLGIDYGRAKIGLATADGKLAEPLRVFRVKSKAEAVKKVVELVQALQAEKVVVGVSEGDMGREQEKFALRVKSGLTVPVITWDETLTTQDAQAMAIGAGVPIKRRKNMEDAFAAAVMLQSFLDFGDF